MLLPSQSEAETLLTEAEHLNPGPWVAHSRLVAAAAEAIATACGDLDTHTAHTVGLLHDIGRRFGVSGARHVMDGYRYLSSKGYAVPARVCLTHSYPYQHVDSIFGADDLTPVEHAELDHLLMSIEYDDFDRLIQLCDSLAMASGYVLIEKRLVDVLLRYGPNEYIVPKWRAIMDLKAYFDRRVRGSIYHLLPGVVENTFR
jgi:hypothetical protein